MADNTQQACAFEIKALAGVGDLIHEGDKFDLVGRALPYRGLSFEVTQRIQTTWYPGNPVATQQAMGATDSNTTIQGVWKDRYLGDPGDPTFAALMDGSAFDPVGDGQASNLIRNFELLCRYAVPVEVRWGAGFSGGTLTGQVVVRRGLIKRFKWTPDRPQDQAWEMEFEWRGTEQTAAKPVAVKLTDARAQLTQLASQFDDASDVLKGIKETDRALLYGIPAAASAAIDDITTALDAANEQVADIVAGVVGGIHADGGILDYGNASYAIALLTSSVDSIRKGVEQIKALPLYAISVRDDALDLLTLTSDLFGGAAAAEDVLEDAVAARDDLAGQTFQGVVAEVHAAAGTDLRDLALRFYGNADLWFTIAKYNGLSTSLVPALPDGPSDQPGRLIQVPAQSGAVKSVGDVC